MSYARSTASASARLMGESANERAGCGSVHRDSSPRGKVFTAPKTTAGNRTAALSGWLVAQLKAHLERSGAAEGDPIFATGGGEPLNPSNMRPDIWTKVLKRAGVRALDTYSLRHTFASLGRVAGEEAFNVARAMGHSRSMLVDQVYAHSLQSVMASVAERVTARALGDQPKLRVSEGGNSRDIKETLEDCLPQQENKQASG